MSKVIGPPTSVEVLDKDWTTRADAAARDAEGFRDRAADLSGYQPRSNDPAYDVIWKVRDRYLELAEILDDLAVTFRSYALDEDLANAEAAAGAA